MERTLLDKSEYFTREIQRLKESQSISEKEILSRSVLLEHKFDTLQEKALLQQQTVENRVQACEQSIRADNDRIRDEVKAWQSDVILFTNYYCYCCCCCCCCCLSYEIFWL